MAGDKPGGRHGALLAYACLGAAFVVNAIFFTVDRLGAEQVGGVSRGALMINVAEAADLEPATQFMLRIYKETDRVKLKGQLPSEEDHKTVLGLVKANFPSTDLVDRLKIAEGTAKTNMRVGSVSFALKALSYLQTGTANVDGASISLEGEVSADAIREEVLQFIKTTSPTGVTLKNVHIGTPPKSFIWRADLQDNQVRIIGPVPDENGRQAIRERARMLFSGVEIIDQTRVAQGAPEGWTDAALHSLMVLQLLKSGYIQMTDQAIRVEGVATDEQNLVGVDVLADKFPSGFSLESHVDVPSHTVPGTDNKPTRADADGGFLSIPQATAAER